MLKQAISLLIVILMIAGALVIFTGSTIADPPATGDWTIAESTTETVSDQTILMTGNITVVSLGTLNLDNCTIIFDCTFDNQYWFDVQTGGSLTMTNCVVKSNNASNRYSFWIQASSQATVSFTGIRDVHNGLELHSNSASLSFCDITNSDVGVHVYASDPTIDNCVIKNNDNQGIYVHTGSSPTITNNHVKMNNHYGIYVHEGTPDIEDNDISTNSHNGIYCVNTAGAFAITDNRIRYNEGQGITLEQSSPTISLNTIDANQGNGIYVLGSSSTNSNPTISNNDITGNGGDGIEFDNIYISATTNDNNIYNNFGWGIQSYGGMFTDSNNIYLDANGLGNRWGRIHQMWYLEVNSDAAAGFYMFNPNFSNGVIYCGRIDLDYWDQYWTEYEWYNDNTYLTMGTYEVVGDRTGNDQMDSATTDLTTNTVIDLIMADAPDVSVTAITWGGTPGTGDTETITFDITNDGDLDAADSEVDVYLQDPNGDITYLTRLTPGAISASATVQDTYDITFAGGGTYTIIADCDPDNDYWEEDDTEPSSPYFYQDVYSETITIDGYSVYIEDLITYINEPYWNWRSMTANDRVSVYPGSWRSYRLYVENYRGSSDTVNIIETHNTDWNVIFSTDSNPSTATPITQFSLNGWQNRYVWVHTQPPDPAPRGSNLNLDITLQSDNDNTITDDIIITSYADWVIPEGTTETVSAETQTMDYNVYVSGTLNLDQVDWTIHNYPMEKHITILDGGMGDFNDVMFTSSDDAYEWHFYVYGDLDLTLSEIYYSDYGIEVYTDDYPANVNIEGNTIMYSNNDGIVLNEAYAVIKDNIISNNQDAGIDGQNSWGSALITGNTFENNQQGISMRLKSDQEVVVSNNEFMYNNEGLLIDSFADVISSNNEFYFNNYGIQVADHAILHSTNDLMRVNLNDGLWMNSYAQAVCYDMTITHNAQRGIRAQYRSHLAVHDSNIISNHYMALHLDESDAIIEDTIIGESVWHGVYNGDDDFLLETGSDLTLTNCTFDRDRIYYTDTESTVTVEWYLQVHALDSLSMGVLNLPTTIEDGLSNQVFNGTTDSSGYTSTIASKEVILSPAGDTDYSLHTITVTNGNDIVETVTLTANMVVDVVLDYAVDLEILNRIRAADPLEDVVFDLQVTNVGDLNDTFDLFVVGNDTWNPVLEQTTVSLDPAATTTVTLTLTVPQKALADLNESFAVTAESNSDEGRYETINVFIVVNKVWDVEVIPIDDEANILPSTYIHKMFRVTNTGSVPDTYTITAPVASWMSAATVDVSSVTLLPWDSVEVTVNVTCAAGVQVGTQALTLSATGTGVSDLALVNMGILQVYSAAMTIPTVSLVAGEQGTYTVTLDNTGNGDDIIKISDDSAYVEFDMDYASVNWDSSVDLTMTVMPALGLNTSTEVVTITLLHADEVTTTQLTFDLSIIARDYNITLSAPFTAIELEQGSYKTFDVSILNSGNARDVITLSYSGVTWMGGFENTTFDIDIDGSDSTGFWLQVPEWMAVGNYTLNLIATFSGQTYTLPITIDVIEKDYELTWTLGEQKSPAQGQAKVTTLTLRNSGNYTTTAYLSVSDLMGFGTIDIESVELDPGATQTVLLTVSIPTGFTDISDPYAITVTANYGYNATKSADQQVDINIKEKDPEPIIWTVLSGVLAGIICLIVGLLIGFVVVKMMAGGSKAEDDAPEEEAPPEEETPKKRKPMKKKVIEGDEEVPEGEDVGPGKLDELPDGEMEEMEEMEEMPAEGVETWSTEGGEAEGEMEPIDDGEMEPMDEPGDIEPMEEMDAMDEMDEMEELQPEFDEEI